LEDEGIRGNAGPFAFLSLSVRYSVALMKEERSGKE
jgi:hypothetical protein